MMNTQKRPINFKKTLLAICAVFLLLSVCTYWSVESPAVSGDQLKQMAIGMTMTDVEKILGKPLQKKETDSKSATWIYGHALKWYSLTIIFDSNGRITSFTHDD
jgi:outer membrane protein assembly factor BamE (lipoprotein component of BamABCDE complex)